MYALVLLAAIAAAPGKHCLDSTLAIASHVPGGGYNGETKNNEVTGIDKIVLSTPGVGSAHIGYLYHTGGKRDVFAGRTTPQVGVKYFDRIVALYTQEGFPRDDAEALVEAGPPILMWLPHTDAFLNANHLTRQACVD